MQTSSACLRAGIRQVAIACMRDVLSLMHSPVQSPWTTQWPCTADLCPLLRFWQTACRLLNVVIAMNWVIILHGLVLAS